MKATCKRQSQSLTEKNEKVLGIERTLSHMMQMCVLNDLAKVSAGLMHS